MRKKQIVSLLLSAAMVLSMAACGNKDAGSGDTGSAGSAGNAAAGTESGGSAGGSDAGGGAASGKSVSYWIDPQQGGITNATTFDDAPCWQAIQENTGIDVVWEHPASGQAQIGRAHV